MSKNRIAVILISVVLMIAEVSQVCFAFPGILDDVPEKQILTVETSAGQFSDAKVSRAFKLLNYLDIISENEKDFEEDAAVTRAYAITAFAAMCAGGGSSGAAETFSDVPAGHEYASGIRQALDLGIIDRSKDKFYPNRNVSYEDVAIWAIKVLNYEFLLNNKQPLPAAVGIGIFKGIDLSADTITMGMFLRILENALNTDLVNVTMSKDNPSYKTDKTETYLSSNYNVYLHKGVITGYKYSSLYGEGELESGKVQINRASYKLNEELSVDCVGYSVCAYVDIEDERKIAALWMDNDKNKTYEIKKEDYDSFEASAIRYGRSKRININGSIRMMQNNLFSGYYGTADLGKLPETDKIIVIDNDGDGKGDLIKVYKYTHYYVKTVSVTDECVVFGNDLGKQDISDNVYSEFVFEDKIVDPYTDLKANDVLTVLEGTADGKEVFCAEICRDIAEGNISMIGTDPVGTFYVLDGEHYYLSDNLINYMKKNSSEKNVGEYVHAYLGSDKRIAYLKTEDDFSFGYLMGAGYDDIEDELIITVCTLDGSKEKFRSAEKVKVYDHKYQSGK